MLLDGKTALVTGASRGIGRAIALRLAAEGASVAINYAGNTAKAEETKAAIEAAGGKAALFQADVSDSAQVERMVAAVTEMFGTIDILVNNAGITRDGLLMRMKEEDFDAVLDTNLKGIFHVTKAVSKLMMKKPRSPSFAMCTHPFPKRQRCGLAAHLPGDTGLQLPARGVRHDLSPHLIGARMARQILGRPKPARADCLTRQRQPR